MFYTKKIDFLRSTNFKFLIQISENLILYSDLFKVHDFC